MEVQIIPMNSEEARKKFIQYRAQVRLNRERRQAVVDKESKKAGQAMRAAQLARAQLDKEDEILRDVYRAFANGQRVVNLASVMRQSELFPDTLLPKLAVARADWPECHIDFSNENVTFQRDRWSRRTSRSLTYAANSIRFSSAGWNPKLVRWDERRAEFTRLGRNPVSSAKAMVPSIPVQFRPADSLENYHILWEAEWSPQPPVDPILLKHIAGDMFAVLAQWDLTEIERSVLEGRLR